MASSKDTALDRLLHLASVNVKQKATRVEPNMYMVTAPDDEVLFTMKEEGSMLTVFRNRGQSRAFHIDAVDSQEKPVFSLRRPFSFSSDKVEVSIHGALVSVVRMERTFFKAVYSINDANDRPMLRVKGQNMTHNNFQLQSFDKRPIGTISKHFRGILNEMYSFTDDYVITFPVDLEVWLKLAVISACILIDYRFHEL